MCHCLLLKFANYLGHNFKTCVYNSLKKYGISVEKIKLFSNEFNNDNAGEYLKSKSDVSNVMSDEIFKKLLHDDFSKCIKEYQNVLQVFELIEDFFNPILAFVLMNSICYVIFMLYAAISVN